MKQYKIYEHLAVAVVFPTPPFRGIFMKQYKIYEHPAGAIEAVKLGWSWPAFFFVSIWALFKQMWVLGGCVLAASIFFSRIFAGSLLLEILLVTVPAVIFGRDGNRWRENNLQSRGYDYKETHIAAKPEGAVALYLKQKSNAPVQPHP